jgi:predicted Zn-dependent protease
VQADSALASDPLNLEYQVFRATVYAGTGRYDEAGNQLEAVLRSIPNHPVALAGLANIHHARGKEEMTVQYLVDALRAEGKSSVADFLQRSFDDCRREDSGRPCRSQDTTLWRMIR